MVFCWFFCGDSDGQLPVDDGFCNTEAFPCPSIRINRPAHPLGHLRGELAIELIGGLLDGLILVATFIFYGGGWHGLVTKLSLVNSVVPRSMQIWRIAFILCIRQF